MSLKTKFYNLPLHTRPNDSYSLDMDQVCGVLELYKFDIDQVSGELAERAVNLLTDTLTLSQRERVHLTPSPSGRGQG
jgi:hypothetical protein